MSFLIGLLILLAGSLLGWAARYIVIEPTRMMVLCAGDVPPAWCSARELLITVTFHGVYGVAAAGAGAAAWLLRGRTAAAFAVFALFAGGLGLYLYDTGWAASGILAALLRLARVGEDPPDPREFTA